VPAEDAEGRKKLAGYMLRAPMSLQKMTYDAASRAAQRRRTARAAPTRREALPRGLRTTRFQHRAPKEVVGDIVKAL